MTGSKDFLGRGWSFPPRRDALRGGVSLAQHDEKVRQSMRVLLGTGLGERAMRPEYGCGLQDLVFESLDTTTLGRVEHMVEEALRRFEPRIDVHAVRASVTDAIQGRLSVSIDYEVRSVNRRDNLVYDFYLRGRA